MERRDVVIIASVSAIYGLGDPESYMKMLLHLKVGDIVKTTVFVKDLNDFATVNATYEAFFTEHNATFPARSCVEVARLPKDVKIEIEAIAIRR